MGNGGKFDSLVVRPVRRDEIELWGESMRRHHYLGYRWIAGRSLRYVATLDSRWVALIGWGSAVLKCTARDRFIGWDSETKLKRLYLIANNARFLILPSVSIRNLASKVLSMNLKRLSNDFRAVYGHPIYLAETFVDESRGYRGSCYRAANWRFVGLTSGWSRNAGRYYRNDQPKAVFLYPLRKDAKEILTGDFIPYDFNVVEREGDMNKLKEFPVEGLMEEIRRIKDPRKARGIRHSLGIVLGIAVCAVLCGARSYRAIGDWAGALTKEMLKRFGGDRSKPPSEPTIRRLLQAVDAEEFDARIGQWVLNQQLLTGKAIAMDGKTLRGSRDGEQSPVHLLSAVVHKEGIVIAQQRVDEKTNEITQVQPLLDKLNLKGAVVTADALLTQKNIAKYLVAQKQADYVFTVKGNQQTLRDDIRDLDFKKKLTITRTSTRSTGE
jgi:predicted transposase YbfD/YdcC